MQNDSFGFSRSQLNWFKWKFVSVNSLFCRQFCPTSEIWWVGFPSILNLILFSHFADSAMKLYLVGLFFIVCTVPAVFTGEINSLVWKKISDWQYIFTWAHQRNYYESVVDILWCYFSFTKNAPHINRLIWSRIDYFHSKNYWYRFWDNNTWSIRTLKKRSIHLILVENV